MDFMSPKLNRTGPLGIPNLHFVIGALPHVRNMAPDSQFAEQRFRGLRQCADSGIIALRLRVEWRLVWFKRDPVQQRNPTRPASRAEVSQKSGQAGAYHAAAGNDNVKLALLIHRFIIGARQRACMPR